MDMEKSSDPKEVGNGSIQIIPEEEQTVTAPFLPAYTNTYSRTRLEITTFDFTWKIDKFYFIYNNVNSLHSPLFGDKFKYMIKMVIERDAFTKCSAIKFYLCTTTNYTGSCIVTVKCPSIKYLLSRSISGRIYNKTLLFDIPSSEINFYHHKNATFTIQCHFDIIHRQVTNVINMTSPSSTIFLKDVKSLENSNLDEFEFKVESIKFIVGHEQYLVPKKMLCAMNSSYFKNICLKKGNKEVDMTELLKDDEVEDFKLLLLFIISQDLENPSNRYIHNRYIYLINMLKIANKYDVLTLKLMCEHSLLNEITTETVVELIQLAFSSNTTFLKMHLASFIKLHKSEIVTTKEFRDLSQKDADEIMELVERSTMLQHITQDIDSTLAYEH